MSCNHDDAYADHWYCPDCGETFSDDPRRAIDIEELQNELNAELAMKRVYIQQITTLEAQLAEARESLRCVERDVSGEGTWK